MAEIELIQDRLISGKGVLKVPTDVVKNRLYILYADVIRKPRNQYLNFNFNPPRSKYAWLVFMRNGYVLHEKSVEFPKHVFDGVNDISGQTMLALKCAYKGILQTFVNLGLGLGLPPISVTDTIAEYQNLRLAWDEVRVVCYADTAIQCRLYRLIYDVCDSDLDDDFPPPPPDEPLPPVPPGTPIDNLSEPYDNDTDDGNTIPYPGDSPPPPIPATYRVRIIGSSYGGGCFVFPADDVYADLGEFDTDNLAIEETGTGPICGGFLFVVRNLDTGAVVYTGPSEAISLSLEITLVEE